MDDPADAPRVTPALLRRAESMCRRRLEREHHGAKRHANSATGSRFEVSNRVQADARLAQTELGPPRPEAFVEPAELEPEQRALYRAAVLGYLGLFGDRPGRVTDLGWSTSLPELGVDLLGDVGIAVELPDGRRELRVLHLGTRRAGSPLLDDVSLRFALVRTRDWAPEQLTVVAADLVAQDTARHAPELPRERDEAYAWIAERVQLVQQLAADGRARAGADCSGCAFVAGCEEFRG